MPIIHLDGVPVHYAEHGRGPRAVIFMHGGFGSSSEPVSYTHLTLPTKA